MKAEEKGLLIPMGRMVLCWNVEETIVNVKHATQIISLDLPVDVRLPQPVGAEFKTANSDGPFELIPDKVFVCCVVNTAVVQIV